MLLAAWAVSLLFDVGDMAHALLGLALLVALVNIIWAGFSAK